eukprot:scaffold119385_cov17-Tisochrysis_lutea.AAC.1
MAETSVDDLLQDLLGDEESAPEAGQHASSGPHDEEAPLPAQEQQESLKASNTHDARAELTEHTPGRMGALTTRVRPHGLGTLAGHSTDGARDDTASTQGIGEALSLGAKTLPDLQASEAETRQLQEAVQQQQQERHGLASPEASNTAGESTQGKSVPAGGDAQQFVPAPNESVDNEDMLEGLDDVFGPTSTPNAPQAGDAASFGDAQQQQQQ